MTDVRADAAAPRLRRLVRALHRLNPRAGTTLLCHSYGSVVCGEALRGLPVNDVAAFGSPGMRAATVGALGTRANVWAARGSGDWIQLVPHVHVLGLGFGADPVSPGFGARVFAAGFGGAQRLSAAGFAVIAEPGAHHARARPPGHARIGNRRLSDTYPPHLSTAKSPINRPISAPPQMAKTVLE